MNLDHLRYFTEASQRLHFGRAAQRLGVSSSAINHGIAAAHGLCAGLVIPQWSKLQRKHRGDAQKLPGH